MEIRNGHLLRDNHRIITLGDVSKIRNKYSYPGFLNDTDKAIMAYIAEHGASSSLEIADGIGCTLSTVTKHLRWMGASRYKVGKTYYYAVSLDVKP